MGVWADVALIALFILVGAVFAASEMALVSLRHGQIRSLTAEGGRAAKAAGLAQEPSKFLAAVQIGVTLAGFLSAAFGAATLADRLSGVLQDHGWMSDGVASTFSLVVVTVVISYFSIVLSELAPKRIALQRAEGTARTFGPLIALMASLARPVVWLLSRSSDLVVRLFGIDPKKQREAITPEELRGMVAAHEELSPDERKLIDEVFEGRTTSVREVMIPRTEAMFLDAGVSVAEAVKLVGAMPYSRYPVIRGSRDDVVGFVHVRDLMTAQARPGRARVGDVARDMALLPDTRSVLAALSDLRRGRHHIAVVMDEYGGTAGIVTLEDLIEELVGDIRDEYDRDESAARRLGAETEVEGLLNLSDFEEETGIALPEGPYETVAGYVIAMLGRLPALSDEVAAPGARLVVTGVDGRRVSRIHVRPEPAGTAPDGPSPPAGGEQPATPTGPDGSSIRG